nr:HBS1-like protein [Paratrimastix eleionoma]
MRRIAMESGLTETELGEEKKKVSPSAVTPKTPKTPVITVTTTTTTSTSTTSTTVTSSPAPPLKEGLNLVVIGHVDAGKSTLMGHLLYIEGQVSQKTMHKYEKESRAIGKATFAYAWVLDSHEEERERGVTMDVATASFETPHKRVTILDTPGHVDFVPNMISGAAQADAAVMVVDSVTGAYEAGFHAGGQTREHALLAKGLGVSHLIVVINKMDTFGTDALSNERFQFITGELQTFLTKNVGFSPEHIQFIPVSGLHGWNLEKKPTPSSSSSSSSSGESTLGNSLSWYTGPTLVEAIDELPVAENRRLDIPFRLSIMDVTTRPNQPGIVLSGKIEGGSVRIGDSLTVVPSMKDCLVKEMEMNGKSTSTAQAGDHVDLVVSGLSINLNEVNTGDLLCGCHGALPHVVTRFEAHLLALATNPPLMAGAQVLLYIQSKTEAAILTQCFELLDKNGKIIKRRPRLLPRGSTARVEITTKAPVCVELASHYRQLGRFVIRQSGQTVGAGIITAIPEQISTTSSSFSSFSSSSSDDEAEPPTNVRSASSSSVSVVRPSVPLAALPSSIPTSTPSTIPTRQQRKQQQHEQQQRAQLQQQQQQQQQQSQQQPQPKKKKKPARPMLSRDDGDF